MRIVSVLWIGLLILAAAFPASARLSDAILNYDGKDNYPLPLKLSQTGLYASTSATPKVVTEGIEPFEVNAALWSDGSHKERYVTLPAGTKVTPTDSDSYVFPDKSVMVKNFLIDTIEGNPASRIYVETRFLVFRKGAEVYEDKWIGISYAWKRDQSDADLVSPLFGLAATLGVRTGTFLKGKRWMYPSRGGCTGCHQNRGTLGFITPQLNRPSKANASINQLQSLFSKGLLTANPVQGKPAALKWAALDDASASLEVRARSYFAANCSHCHGNKRAESGEFGGNITHSFDYFTATKRIVLDSANPFEAGPYVGKQGSINDGVGEFLIKPGTADSSLIVRRMVTRGTFEEPSLFAMPAAATYQVDSAAVKVVADWVCSLAGKPAGACKLPNIAQPAAPEAKDITGLFHRNARPSARGLAATWSKGRLRVSLPPALAGARVALLDMQGRSIALEVVGKGEYRIGKDPAPGVYSVSAGGESAPVRIGF